MKKSWRVCNRNKEDFCFLAACVLILQSTMIYVVLCCKVPAEREAYLPKMRPRVCVWLSHNSSILPPEKKRKKKDTEWDEEYERTQLLVVWTEEREKKTERKKEKAWLATTYLSASFFYCTESKDWVHHWLSLSSHLFYFFSNFPSWLEDPVIHSCPCCFLGSSSALCFLVPPQFAHNIHLSI